MFPLPPVLSLILETRIRQQKKGPPEPFSPGALLSPSLGQRKRRALARSDAVRFQGAKRMLAWGERTPARSTGSGVALLLHVGPPPNPMGFERGPVRSAAEVAPRRSALRATPRRRRNDARGHDLAHRCRPSRAASIGPDVGRAHPESAARGKGPAVLAPLLGQLVIAIVLRRQAADRTDTIAASAWHRGVVRRRHHDPLRVACVRLGPAIAAAGAVLGRGRAAVQTERRLQLVDPTLDRKARARHQNGMAASSAAVGR